MRFNFIFRQTDIIGNVSRAILTPLLVIPILLLGQSKKEPMNIDKLPADGRGSYKVAFQNNSIDAMIYDFMEENQIPGLTLAIVQAPYIPRVVGYGLSDIEEKRLASTNTVFAIGPISQAFAAVATFQLLEKGKLSLQDKISKYLKDIPVTWNSVTINQLLQHASGIPDYRNGKGYNTTTAYKATDLYGMVKDSPLLFKSGTDVKLSATNFLVLAEIIEKASGMRYHDFVTKYQINFLGLKHTMFAEDIPNLKQEDVTKQGGLHKQFKSDVLFINPTENAVGYNNGLDRVPLNKSEALKGFGDIWASAEDISFWDIGLAGSILIAKPENRDLVYKPTKLDSGEIVRAMAGWQFPHHKGLMDIKGTVPGFSSFLSRFTDPSELVCVTLLVNKEGVDLSNLGRRIASAFGTAFQSGANEDELYVLESVHSVEETTKRLEAKLAEMNVPVFAVFDHSKNAETVNMQLRPTKVIVFGSPAVGTNLMIANQSIANELPLKMTVWEDEKGSVWISFPWIPKMAGKYGLKDNPIIRKMQLLMEKLALEAGSVY